MNYKLFLLSTVGIFSSFILNGIMTEYNYTKRYDGQRFKFSTGYILIQTFIMLVVTILIRKKNK